MTEQPCSARDRRTVRGSGRLHVVTALSAFAGFLREQSAWRDRVADEHNDGESRDAANALGALATYLDSAEAEGLSSPIVEAVRSLGDWYRPKTDDYALPEGVRKRISRCGYHGPTDPARFLDSARWADED
jgi:hypothetical protein